MRRDLEVKPTVYAVRSAGLIKIGYTQNLGQRLANLRCNSALSVLLIDSAPGTRGDEVTVHAIFHSSRRHGEWFMLDGENLRRLKEVFNELRETKCT